MCGDLRGGLGGGFDREDGRVRFSDGVKVGLVVVIEEEGFYNTLLNRRLVLAILMIIKSDLYTLGKNLDGE